jgi:hypothetical protein
MTQRQRKEIPMPFPKAAFRLALLGCALILSVLASQSRLTAGTCKDGNTRFVFNGCCSSTGPDGLILAEMKGQSCLFGTWTDNGLSECAGPCFIPAN